MLVILIFTISIYTYNQVWNQTSNGCVKHETCTDYCTNTMISLTTIIITKGESFCESFCEYEEIQPINLPL